MSLLPSPHNLHAYEELGMTYSHISSSHRRTIPRMVLKDLYAQLHDWIASGERLLIHQEELSDRLIGTVGGYLIATKMIDSGAQAIMIMERLTTRQMGPTGRELVAVAGEL